MKRKIHSLSCCLLFLLPTGKAAAAAPENLVVAPGEEIQLRSQGDGATVEAVLDGGVLRPVGDAVTAPEEGRHWLTVATRDAAGRRSDPQWIRIDVDGKPPVLEWVLSPEPFVAEDGRKWISRQTSLVVSASDRPAGVKNLDLFEGEGLVHRGSGRANWSPSAAGEAVLSAFAIDAVGNLSATEVEALWVDERPPEGSIEVRAAKRIQVAGHLIVPPSAVIDVSWVDDGSGVGQTSLQVDGLSVADAAALTPWSGGVHRVTAGAADRVNNAAKPLSREFVVDATAPEIKWSVTSRRLISSNGTIFARPPVAIDLRAEDATAGVDVLECLDGGTWSSVEGIVETSSEGLRVRAVDAVGNTCEMEIGWVVDDRPPEISLVDLEGRKLAESKGVIRVRPLTGARLEVEDDGVGGARMVQRIGTGDFSPPPERYIFHHSGRRTLEVLAVDALGNEARRSFVVEVGR